ncbi:MAG: M28 family peptidase, partial [Deltaproteobacteria bacterium]|nr:M28 family peptidase [Deltaproteobacteria bacterium]
MRTRNLLSLVLALLAVSAVTALATPVELYLVKFAPGTDIYRLAGSQNWPVYHISGQQALLGRKLSNSDNKEVLGTDLVFQGPSENLRWVHLKRNGQMPVLKSLYYGNDMLLAESGSVMASGIKSGRDHTVKNFIPQPLMISKTTSVNNKGTVRDTVIAALTHLVDTAGVRSDIEALQAFNTRSTVAPNHQQVTEWIRDEFLSYGITDVVIDSFISPDFTDYTQYYFGNSEVYKIRNVVATIPGSLDTQSVYIVGGHFDTSVWPYNDWAPGADDNGSGTTAVLQSARVLSAHPPKATVKLIALDCEEWGLYGAEHYAAQALAQGMNVQCMLN